MTLMEKLYNYFTSAYLALSTANNNSELQTATIIPNCNKAASTTFHTNNSLDEIPPQPSFHNNILIILSSNEKKHGKESSLQKLSGFGFVFGVAMPWIFKTTIPLHGGKGRRTTDKGKIVKDIFFSNWKEITIFCICSTN